MPKDEYTLNTEQAAKLAKVSTKTIMRWRIAGKISYRQMTDRSCWYSPRELKQLTQGVVVKANR